MKPYQKIISTLIMILFLSGCAGTRQAVVNPDANMKDYKKAFIVANEYSKLQTPNIIVFPGGGTAVPGPVKKGDTRGNIPNTIQRELLKHDISSIIGTKSDIIPDDVDIIVKYEDLWEWDLKYYIKTLSIKVIDKKTEKEIAQGNFKSAIAHNFPNVNKEIAVIIESIFKDRK